MTLDMRGAPFVPSNGPASPVPGSLILTNLYSSRRGALRSTFFSSRSRILRNPRYPPHSLKTRPPFTLPHLPEPPEVTAQRYPSTRSVCSASPPLFLALVSLQSWSRQQLCGFCRCCLLRRLDRFPCF